MPVALLLGAGSMLEHRIFGPPGSGKTTKLTELVRRAANTFAGSVMVTSFTRTAAQELVQRGVAVHKSRVGTLHSFCYRVLGAPDIAETHASLEVWNKGHGMRKGWQISAKDQDVDDPMTAGTQRGQEASKIWAIYSAYRNRMFPRDRWEPSLRDFATAWEDHKREHDVLDFTDLIEITLREHLEPPCAFAVLFADEVQDYSPLELALVRLWGKGADHWVLSGDDQQCIFGFRGATPEAFLDPPLPPDQVTVLPKSYRLSSAIKDYAWSYGTNLERYQHKEFSAVKQGGRVERSPLRQVDGIGIAHFCEEEVARGRSVMVLGTCSYMLEPALRALKARGLPFHNPYRKQHGGWNPMRGATSRLAAFLAAVPTWADAWRWMEHVDAKEAQLGRGAKNQIKELAKDQRSAELEVDRSIFRMATGIEWPNRDPNWLLARLLTSKSKSYTFAEKVFETRGRDALVSEPKVILGTIHSVKGGEADSVLLFPDMSRAAYGEQLANGRPGRDATTRVFYVGMTRARDRLALAQPSGSMAVQFPSVPSSVTC